MNNTQKVGRLVDKGWSNDAIAEKMGLEISSVIAYKAKYTQYLNKQAQGEYPVKDLPKVFTAQQAAEAWDLTPGGALYNIKKKVGAGQVYNVSHGKYSTEKRAKEEVGFKIVKKKSKEQELPFGKFEFTHPNAKLYLEKNKLTITW